MKNRLTIQSKITLLASLCLITVVGLLVTISLYQTKSSTDLAKDSASQMLSQSAQQTLQAKAEAQALQVQGGFTRAYEFGLGVSRHVLYMRATGRDGNPAALRATLTEELRKALAGRPEVLGLFLAFEPNELDHSDADFKGRGDIGSNDSGRYSVYWVQSRPGELQAVPGDEKLLADTSTGPSGAPFNAFLTCPRDTGKPCLTEPYIDDSLGVKRLVSSISIPLVVDNKVIAVIGLDISLDNLQGDAVSAAQKLYDGQAALSIISPSGVIAANSAAPDTLGKRLSDVAPQESAQILDLLKNRQPQTYGKPDEIRLVVPMEPIPRVVHGPYLSACHRKCCRHPPMP